MNEVTPACVHRWRVAPPNGAESQAICSKCGAVRTFPNATPDPVPMVQRKPDLAEAEAASEPE